MKITNATEYLAAVDAAFINNGLDDGFWNDRFLKRLDENGLSLSVNIATGETYPEGLAYMAPISAANSANPYTYPSYIVVK